MKLTIFYLIGDGEVARRVAAAFPPSTANWLIAISPIFANDTIPNLPATEWGALPITRRSKSIYLSSRLAESIDSKRPSNLILLIDEEIAPDIPKVPIMSIFGDLDSINLSNEVGDSVKTLIYPTTSGFDASTPYSLYFPLSVAEIGLPKKVSNTLEFYGNLRTVGQLVQRTDAELLRIPSFGRESLRHVKKVLQRFDLRLGMDLPGWDPDPTEQAVAIAEAAHRVLKIGQAPLGATFEPDRELLRINAAGSESDFEAAKKPLVRQLHPEIVRKAARFQSVAPRLDNQIGWTGISALSERLYGLVNRDTEEVPEVLGTLYSAALELGSFLEMDRKIAAGESSFAPPLDVEVSRPLEDLLRSLAPWLRSFPTVREMDDEAGRFLTRDPLLKPSSTVVDAALVSELIPSEDAAALHALIGASDRGEFQGIKAGHRGVLSVRNMVIAATSAISLFLLSAVESDFATKSVLVQKAGTFLAKAEGPILEVLASLPQDLRLAVEAMIKETRDSPPIPSRQPVSRTSLESERVRRRR